jgi:hypothetical protein
MGGTGVNFLVQSQGGAKSQRITYSHPTSNLKFTVYPMAHLGSPHFYEKITQDLELFSYALLEGVTWRRNGKGGPLYDWAASSLGLVTQRNALKLPDHVKRLNIDMPSSLFRRRFLRLPLPQRLLLYSVRPLGWILAKFFHEGFLARRLVETSGRREKYRSPLRRLIRNRRDKHICKELRRFFKLHADVEKETRAAIIFGAGHMAAIHHCLRELGYEPKTKKWLKVFSVEEIA